MSIKSYHFYAMIELNLRSDEEGVEEMIAWKIAEFAIFTVYGDACHCETWTLDDMVSKLQVLYW